jgi:hypothetical protein
MREAVPPQYAFMAWCSFKKCIEKRRTLFSNNLNLCSFLSVRDQVSHPSKTLSKIFLLYNLIFQFLERRREYKCSEPNGNQHFQIYVFEIMRSENNIPSVAEISLPVMLYVQLPLGSIHTPWRSSVLTVIVSVSII